MTAATHILAECAKIVGGDRNTTHGEKERSFIVIANLWNAYLAGRKEPHAPMSPRDVAQLMVLLKMGRSIQGVPVHDHFVDETGYAAIAGELASLERAPPPANDPTGWRTMAEDELLHLMGRK